MGHSHADVSEVPSWSRRMIAWIAGVLALLTVVGLVALWPTEDLRAGGRALNLPSEVYKAEVVRVDRGPCTNTAPSDNVTCDRVGFRLLQGPDEGERRSIDFPLSATTPNFERGDEVVLAHVPNADTGFDYQFADRERRSSLLWLAALFAIAVMALGRLRGLAALVGLGASIAVLLAFVLPAILEGESPVLVAIVGSSAIAYLALYLAHGLRTMTSVALLGTLAALALTVGLAALFTELAHFSGLASEESILLTVGSRGLDLQGLVLAGMVFGALGALDDVTVTQASAVWELRAADPTMSRFALYRAGLRIGRDHVASTVNTLTLAYAGASLPLLIVFVMSRQSLGTVANSEVIAVEIVRTLVGSIGLVAAVPLTTWLAARLAPGSAGRRRRRGGSPGGPPEPPDPAPPEESIGSHPAEVAEDRENQPEEQPDPEAEPDEEPRPLTPDEALAPPPEEEFWRRR